MKLLLCATRKSGPGWAEDACADYGKRIQRYFPFEERTLKPSNPRAEAEALRKALPDRHRLVLLDERGQDLTSPGLADWLEEAALASVGTLAFAIGGPMGHDPSLRAQAWRTVRLSAMVLNHAVARVMLIEQLYRACTIRAGEPYHHI